MITDDDGGAVTTRWTTAELSLVLQSAAYLNQTPNNCRRPTYRCSPTVGDLPTASRTGADRSPTVVDRSRRLHHHLDRIGCRILRDVEAQYSLTAEQAQKYGVQVVNYLLAIGGH